MATRLTDSNRLAAPAASGRRVDLSRAAPFRIGPLTVEPSRRRIAHEDGREEIVQPRVMQVLAALFDARGAILGRDELTDRCWDGRIVGEDSINRVMSRLRRLTETIGEGVFRIETVTKVGYRLVLEHGVRAEAPDPAATAAFQAERPGAGLSALNKWATRRTLLGGTLAAGVAAATPGLWAALEQSNWFGMRGHVPTPEAKRLYDEGMRAQYFALTATSELAEGFFRQAAEADPEWADAWGSLAMSYRHMMDGETNVSQWRLVEQTRSAANRALELDPNNAEALVALALIRSPYRRWDETEREYRALLERFPNAFVLRGHLGRLLRDVGRYADALPLTTEALRQQSMIPTVVGIHAQTLWGLGRLHEAAATYDHLIRRWPKHVGAWLAYTQFLIFSGRPEAAAAFASEREARPSDAPDLIFDRWVLVARAVATRDGAAIQAARSALDTFVARSMAHPSGVIPVRPLVDFFAAIGDLDSAFAALDGYFFDRGRFGPPQPRQFGPLTRRQSDYLFLPAAAPLWRDSRFKPLLEEIGLMDYWRRSGTRPNIWPQLS